MPLIRYPGSKAKLRRTIAACLPDAVQFELWQSGTSCYCEPFFGSGAVGFGLLKAFAYRRVSVRLNDLDPGIAALWNAVLYAPGELVTLIDRFRPTQEAFYECKRLDGEPGVDPVLRGFRKLVLHRTSFSGLGAMAGGPLGGRDGRSEYHVGCRWNAARMRADVKRLHAVLKRFADVRITCMDFVCATEGLPGDAFAYLDPPYYVQGAALYKHAFREEDHVRLAALLHGAQFRWVLSYDDHPRIRELYAWADIRDFEMTPTTRTARGPRRKNREIVIRSGNWQ